MADAAAGPIALEARGLTRRYGDVDVVRALSFSVRVGEVVGFLGHNGAGKSTTMRMLAGALAPTSGAALIYGAPSSTLAARRSVGFLPETPPLTAELTVQEQLAFVAAARFAHARVPVVP
ncbi:MAG TPA: ATP-binding cassette domain-containing protein, partial [Myxococcota bacterium]